MSLQEAHIYFHEKHNQWFRQKHSLCFHEKHNCASTVLLEREKQNLCLYEKHSDSARSTTCLSLKKTQHVLSEKTENHNRAFGLPSFLLVFLVFFFYTVFVFGTFWYSFLPILRFSFLVYGIFTKKSSLKHINMRFSFDHADAKYAMLKMIWYKHMVPKIKRFE